MNTKPLQINIKEICSEGFKKVYRAEFQILENYLTLKFYFNVTPLQKSLMREIFFFNKYLAYDLSE
jgi:hypothetical protein